MRPPSAWALKGPGVEEWVDLKFFRPLGWALASRLAATPISADQVTLGSLLVGLAAGHLFLYPDPVRNGLGLALFVVSDVLDSADGQLARLTGRSSRAGRVLDGIADSLRFLSLYLHLAARLWLAGSGWWAPALAALAALSHSVQSSAADFVRQAYLALVAGRGTEVDLPENLSAAQVKGRWARLTAWLYRDYVQRQARFFPQTTALLRATGRGALPAALRPRAQAALEPLVRQTAWIGQNIRFALLIVAVAGWPAGYLWLVVGPLNGVLLWVLLVQEQRVRGLREDPLWAGAEPDVA